MKRKNGFTLIELLAVIVILAIIALIAVPVVMNIIDKAQKSAFKDSAYGILKAGDLYYAEQQMSLNAMEKEPEFSFPDDVGGLNINGALPQNGKMRINTDGDIALAISNGKYCAKKDYNDNELTITDDIKNCYLPYKEKLLVGADPVLKTGMIAITIENDGTARKANLGEEWYSYGKKIWANAVTVSEENREKYQNMDAGEIIAEEDILTYLVWIPRYKYKLWYTEAVDKSTEIDTSKVHSIDIVFENNQTDKSDGTCAGEYEEATNGCYLTHPAFTFGDEINGIWVGKFETAYKSSVNQSSYYAPLKDEINPSQVIIKPSIENKKIVAWRSNSLSNQFYTALGMNDEDNVFGLTEETDTHMMKNTEWGAVAYLSHSNYGTCTEGICDVDGTVYINNQNSFMIGCGGDSLDETAVAECKNMFGTKTDGVYKQSTNWNITGIFDMSGGAYEHVMGYTINAGTKYGDSGFIDETFPKDTKYIDLYDTTDARQYSGRILGDATGEMGPFANVKGAKYYELSSWYNDSAVFIPVYANNVWFSRGGRYYGGANQGMFFFRYSNGAAGNETGFRIVLV